MIVSLWKRWVHLRKKPKVGRPEVGGDPPFSLSCCSLTCFGALVFYITNSPLRREHNLASRHLPKNNLLCATPWLFVPGTPSFLYSICLKNKYAAWTGAPLRLDGPPRVSFRKQTPYLFLCLFCSTVFRRRRPPTMAWKPSMTPCKPSMTASKPSLMVGRGFDGRTEETLIPKSKLIHNILSSIWSTQCVREYV